MPLFLFKCHNPNTIIHFLKSLNVFLAARCKGSLLMQDLLAPTVTVVSIPVDACFVEGVDPGLLEFDQNYQ